MALTPEERSGILLENIAGSDCGVIAVQALTGWPRRLAEEALNGAYEPGVGTHTRPMLEALRRRGYKCDPFPFDRGDTFATFAVRQDSGTFICFSETHVICLKEGNPYNCRGHGHKRLEYVVRVEQ